MANRLLMIDYIGLKSFAQHISGYAQNEMLEFLKVNAMPNNMFVQALPINTTETLLKTSSDRYISHKLCAKLNRYAAATAERFNLLAFDTIHALDSVSIRKAWERNHSTPLDAVLQDIQQHPECQEWVIKYITQSFDYHTMVQRYICLLCEEFYYEWLCDLRKAIDSHNTKWLMKHGVIYEDADWK